ncbi:hypothetical protein GUJ93_ZPchr0007g4503 [Zizania palustris]|uniref:Uncharacterized protein n=1 Tax=Zizania palustris TaxID=103762 RepID=A0A8J5SP78_ZIZPA|nr:hypothetical protein GUJ93_ZPchr0007g4503 [Zizania palustris]
MGATRRHRRHGHAHADVHCCSLPRPRALMSAARRPRSRASPMPSALSFAPTTSAAPSSAWAAAAVPLLRARAVAAHLVAEAFLPKERERSNALRLVRDGVSTIYDDGASGERL